ncbi:MAG TPA: hypothetical protein VI997_02285, partial [Candidatus Thermoplasmatota archaeon]|nr:hypothetical protein [Candidatus Thermoplasmatota archaeon]
MRDDFARGEGWYAHVAGPEDNDALLHVLRGVPMGGAVVTAQERAPDFFAWLAAQGGAAEAGLVRSTRDDAPIGLGTSVVRDAFLPDGSVGPLGYIGDIRVIPSWRRARVVPELGRGSLARLRRLYGVELCTMAVADANVPVRQAAVSRSPARAPQPIAAPISRYAMVCVLGRRRHPAAARVERATTADLDEVAGFLDAGQRARVLGEPVPRKRLEERFAAWPGLRPGSFLLARDANGTLAGCAAPWDASPVRRMRVVEYHGALRAMRPALGLLSRLRGM